ncbi:hypothetical protein ACUXST_001134 [Sphingomonas sp. F9_3S_D5_B_2]
MKLVALAALAISLIAAAPAPKTDRSPLRFVDLTRDFDRIWEATRTLPDEQRVDAFETQFGKVLPGFYSADRVKDYKTPEQYRAWLLAGLKDYPNKRAAVLHTSSQFQSLVAPAKRQFESVFGPMRGYPPIYLVNSFGEFDGGTRDLPEGNRLMFGADVIARIYDGKPIKPFIEHELFHLMHHRHFPECEPVWCNLWEEGLATYVASTLNPGADDYALGLTSPRPLRPAVDAHRQEAICAVRQRLEGTSAKDYAPLFMGGGSAVSADLPQRFGYYVGLLVVKETARTHSLKQLAALSPAQVHPLVQRTLERMASCPKTA